MKEERSHARLPSAIDVKAETGRQTDDRQVARQAYKETQRADREKQQSPGTHKEHTRLTPPLTETNESFLSCLPHSCRCASDILMFFVDCA